MLCLLFACTALHAQQAGDLYIQTENNLPFQLKWNGKTYLSSGSGSIVVPQLTAGRQSFVIAIGVELVSEFRFEVDMGAAGRAYSLRQSVDNNWSLFDLVDLTLNRSLPNPAPAMEMVAGSTPAGKSSEKIPAETVETGSLPTAAPAAPKPAGKRKNAVVTAITKIFDKTGSTGIDQVYILNTGARADTIALFIPFLEELPRAGNPEGAAIGRGRIMQPAFAAVAPRKRFIHR